MKTFRVIMSSKDNPDQPLFTTVTECVDMDDAIECVQQTHPDHWIEQITLVTHDTA